MRIEKVYARQIYDSRGVPTVEACVRTKSGVTGAGSAPSGASAGSFEAHEKRDGGKAYFGRGVMTAVEGVNTQINAALAGEHICDQKRIDRILVETDASENKSRLGANALIAVSWAVADAAAKCTGQPLYRYIGGIQASRMPCPMFNVINGGCHAANTLDIQEFMFVPVGASDFHEAMRMGSECYCALRILLKEAGLATTVGDEGGFAPDLARAQDALEWMLRAVERAGWSPGEDVALAIDAAASEWMSGEGYVKPKSGERLTRMEMIDHYRQLAAEYPLISIEDPLGETDFAGFRMLTEDIGAEVMIVGDDLFTTNEKRIAEGAGMGAGNAVLIKPNQIGTISETIGAALLARKSGMRVIVSHRSGETERSAVADLAVAVNADYVKFGAPARSERLAKYNRLLRIEDMLLQ